MIKIMKIIKIIKIIIKIFKRLFKKWKGSIDFVVFKDYL